MLMDNGSPWGDDRESPWGEGNAELADLLASARQYEIRTTRPEAALELREPFLLNFTNPELRRGRTQSEPGHFRATTDTGNAMPVRFRLPDASVVWGLGGRQLRGAGF